MGMKNQMFVLGFLFSEDSSKVLLINKTKPTWQVGKLNGIGGKVEALETNVNAMIRECKEESDIEYRNWQYYTSLEGADWSISVYKGFTDSIFKYKNLTEEQLSIITLSRGGGISYNFPNNIIPNLSWLIPMALTKDQYDIKML